MGGVTAFVAATIATSQQDIKKVLAFSTVSQIGYMVLAVGTGAYIAAIFLMVCHAFYKGLLFLGAGSVIHGLEDEQDLKRMGGLRKWMPWTYGTFLVGWLAIAGIPPLSGFWAKGDVLDNVYAQLQAAVGAGPAHRHPDGLLHDPALQTLAFRRDARWDRIGPHGEPAHHTPHESPWVMRLPLVVLAVAAAVGRRPRPALGLPRQPRPLAGPGVRGHACTTTSCEPAPSGRWPSPTPSPRSSA